jgi:hypothetical protein
MAARDQGSNGAAPPTTVRLQNIAQSYGQSAALMAAVEIGVLKAISSGAGTHEEVARAVVILHRSAVGLRFRMIHEPWSILPFKLGLPLARQLLRLRDLRGRHSLHGLVACVDGYFEI